MAEYPKFAVIGGGSWATAIAKMLCVNLPEIAWYMRNEDAIEHIKEHHHNHKRLVGGSYHRNAKHIVLLNMPCNTPQSKANRQKGW
jgi:glycerol-3-phosphate dehydrogenase (NAD(P)+)